MAVLRGKKKILNDKKIKQKKKRNNKNSNKLVLCVAAIPTPG